VDRTAAEGLFPQAIRSALTRLVQSRGESLRVHELGHKTPVRNCGHFQKLPTTAMFSGTRAVGGSFMILTKPRPRTKTDAPTFEPTILVASGQRFLGQVGTARIAVVVISGMAARLQSANTVLAS